jgi:hypothetical protein
MDTGFTPLITTTFKIIVINGKIYGVISSPYLIHDVSLLILAIYYNSEEMQLSI